MGSTSLYSIIYRACSTKAFRFGVFVMSILQLYFFVLLWFFFWKKKRATVSLWSPGQTDRFTAQTTQVWDFATFVPLWTGLPLYYLYIKNYTLMKPIVNLLVNVWCVLLYENREMRNSYSMFHISRFSSAQHRSVKRGKRFICFWCILDPDSGKLLLCFITSCKRGTIVFAQHRSLDGNCQMESVWTFSTCKFIYSMSLESCTLSHGQYCDCRGVQQCFFLVAIAHLHRKC